MQVDVCIYGGTSGGVAAAIQVVRSGKSVLLIEPGRHVGGMTSGGLGCTDLGKDNAVGGIAMEFYRRIGQAYGLDREGYFFEPHVAERMYREMLAEAGVRVEYEHRVVGVDRHEGRIDRIHVEHVPTDKINAPVASNGKNTKSVRAAVFIDATYEGDLMAAAKVRYMVGREMNAQFGETLNGVRADAGRGSYIVSVDPYVRRGDPESGVLPLVSDESLGTVGNGDHRVQAYCYRLCLTQRSSNRLPIEPPADYDPARFELLARELEELAKIGRPKHLYKDLLILKIDAMPNGKTDVNNRGALSLDYLGANWAYPDADYATRGRIWHDHLDYTKGLLHFLATSDRVPTFLRDEMQTWGLCKDEFTDTQHWPHQLYVREARRMVGQYVMTQGDAQLTRVAPDSIGLGTYPLDSHSVRRIVLNGVAHNEGNMGVLIDKAYPISYRCITPKADQCQNLLVPVCLSATHAAYGSIRMEPTFMILGQSAALAACLAIDSNCSVQDVPYFQLQTAMEKENQILTWSGGGDGVPNPSAGQNV
jgi:hypothetical protein